MKLTKTAVLISTVMVASATVGFTIYADEEEPAPPSTPGTLVENTGGGQAPGDESKIIVDSTTYDPTVLTKFIPGSAFIARTDFLDVLEWNGTGRCITSDSSSAASETDAQAPIELPDGAKITDMTFYGTDSNAADITITLRRAQIDFPGAGAPTRTDALIASFNTSALSGIGAVTHDVSPDEVVGNFTSGGTVSHRFHTVGVTLNNAATAGHIVCGVEIEYQVPTSAVDSGTVLYPITPVRAYDGRIAAYAESGLLAPNGTKEIVIKDGHDAAGAVTALDAVPDGATAVAYNLTIVANGPNFVSVTPGGAASFTASAINFNGTADIANAGIVSIDAGRKVKLWGGDQAGSMFVIIDITGYYLPADHPNMGN